MTIYQVKADELLFNYLNRMANDMRSLAAMVQTDTLVSEGTLQEWLLKAQIMCGCFDDVAARVEKHVKASEVLEEA